MTAYLDIKGFGLPDHGLQWKVARGRLAGGMLWRVSPDGMLQSRSPLAIPEYPWRDDTLNDDMRIEAFNREDERFHYYDFHLHFEAGRLHRTTMFECVGRPSFPLGMVVWTLDEAQRPEVHVPAFSVTESPKMTCKCGEPADIRIVGKKYRCTKCARKIANRILENVGDK